MKAAVFSVEGKQLREIELPKVFDESLNKELIKRAVLSIQSKRKQPKGTKKKAGRDNTAEQRGKRSLPQSERTTNVGKARLPRFKNRRHLLYGRVGKVPQAVGGVRAHPPKSEKVQAEEINKKEKRKALRSAIGASINRELVEKRHVLDEKVKLPIIVEDKFADFEKTKDITKSCETLNILVDLENAKSKRRPRAGKGKQRGRTKKQKISILIVTKDNAKVYKAARNIPGVEISGVDSLNVELFAPGCEPGRLVVWTEDALKALGEKA
ncbi:MAG: 50S ribosomal protein L4 [Candidatus Diapherotrites archaeon]|uniref:50S ribosomal protein L4 n=1 Tax=Candidatus Iainarchaeum sp. TaxID=3101447 RepID=A0A2D6M0R4_9ARCH|nr:50S ribosomal protein L4 [Candidatus Diapherotrites archaeon]|tara:strand:- start:2367 stop:3170 length:804 start_codon:yes stop_codon:yes gene_type:complete